MTIILVMIINLSTGPEWIITAIQTSIVVGSTRSPSNYATEIEASNKTTEHIRLSSELNLATYACAYPNIEPQHRQDWTKT